MNEFQGPKLATEYALTVLANELDELLSYCSHPTDQPLSPECLATFKQRFMEAFLQVGAALHHLPAANRGPLCPTSTTLSQAQSDALRLTALFLAREHMAMTGVEKWRLQTDRALYESLTEFVTRCRRVAMNLKDNPSPIVEVEGRYRDWSVSVEGKKVKVNPSEWKLLHALRRATDRGEGLTLSELEEIVASPRRVLDRFFEKVQATQDPFLKPGANGRGGYKLL